MLLTGTPKRDYTGKSEIRARTRRNPRNPHQFRRDRPSRPATLSPAGELDNSHRHPRSKIRAGRYSYRFLSRDP